LPGDQHLKQAILCVHKALGKEGVVFGAREDVRYAVGVPHHFHRAVQGGQIKRGFPLWQPPSGAKQRKPDIKQWHKDQHRKGDEDNADQSGNQVKTSGVPVSPAAAGHAQAFLLTPVSVINFPEYD
jgi:hypothetical protein